MHKVAAVTAVLGMGVALVFVMAYLAAVLVPDGPTVPVQRQGILREQAAPADGGFEDGDWGEPRPAEPPILIPVAPDGSPVLPGPGAIARPGGTAADPASVVAAAPAH